jgi:hypothetical protein
MKRNSLTFFLTLIIFSTHIFAETSWYEPNGVTGRYGPTVFMSDYELTSKDGKVSVLLENVDDYDPPYLFPVVPNFEESSYSTGFGLGFFGKAIFDFNTEAHGIAAGYPNGGETKEEMSSHNNLLKKILTSDEIDTHCSGLNETTFNDNLFAQGQCRLYADSYIKNVSLTYTLGAYLGGDTHRFYKLSLGVGLGITQLELNLMLCKNC